MFEASAEGAKHLTLGAAKPQIFGR